MKFTNTTIDSQGSLEAARKKEAKLLKTYDYPWNTQQAGCRPRHVDIVVQHSCCSKSTHLVARNHHPSPKKAPPGSTAAAPEAAQVFVAAHAGDGRVAGKGKERVGVGNVKKARRKDGKLVPTWQSFGSASELPA
jgi:hypothetical protein